MKSLYTTSSWKTGKHQDNPTKLAILVPCRDTVETLFTSSLLELVKATTKVGMDVYTMFDTSTILLNQREKLAQQALEMNADYILWLDSDMMFPPTTALRLMAHDKDIVAANYMKRSPPLTTVAYKIRGDWDSWLPLESQTDLEKVEAIGMGCMLMKTHILHDIQKPWFIFEWKDNSWHGEDFFFQEKLRNAGYDIFVDMNLSRQIRHVGNWAFGPSIGTNQEQIIKKHMKKREQK